MSPQTTKASPASRGDALECIVDCQAHDASILTIHKSNAQQAYLGRAVSLVDFKADHHSIALYGRSA